MSIPEPIACRASRREVNVAALIALGASLPWPDGLRFAGRRSMPAITCFIRYEIDPARRDAFRRYAENWATIIPRAGGRLIGYFLPHEGTNDIGWGLIAFDSLAAYEAYRARLREDPDARANFAFAQAEKFIRREERTFLENVPATMPHRG